MKHKHIITDVALSELIDAQTENLDFPNFKGWDSQAHREFPTNLDSEILSLPIDAR